MTLKDIAKEAGVSVSTVSRVIHHKPNAAGKDVQKKIWAIVRKSGYMPNAAAQSLKAGIEHPSSMPASYIVCIFDGSADTGADSFFTSFSEGLEQEAFKYRYLIKYIYMTSETETLSEAAQVPRQTKGAVIFGQPGRRMTDMAAGYFRHVVYAGINHQAMNCDRIICDGHEAAAAAVSELLDLGHTKIAYIGSISNDSCYDGYCAALALRNLPIRNEYIVSSEISFGGGQSGAQKLLENVADFTAVFCQDDSIAAGAIPTLQNRNLRIPKDISVISVGDLKYAQSISPMLTTIHIPAEELGRLAAKTLIDRINGGHRLTLTVTLPFFIVRRESCSEPKSY